MMCFVGSVIFLGGGGGGGQLESLGGGGYLPPCTALGLNPGHAIAFSLICSICGLYGECPLNDSTCQVLGETLQYCSRLQYLE